MANVPQKRKIALKQQHQNLLPGFIWVLKPTSFLCAHQRSELQAGGDGLLRAPVGLTWHFSPLNLIYW